MTQLFKLSVYGKAKLEVEVFRHSIVVDVLSTELVPLAKLVPDMRNK